MTRKQTAVSIGLGILLLGIFLLIWRLTPKAGEPVPPSPLSSMRMGKNAIYASDQPPSREAKIGFAAMADAGFVVIHDDEGGPGRILGVSLYLPAGETRNFSVSVSEALEPGYYFAVLHRDDGNGSFDEEKDLPIVDSSGSVIMMRFLVAEGAAPPADVNL